MDNNITNISKYRNKVFVMGGDYLTKKMFLDRGFLVCNNVTNADLVVFTGGADVSPFYYGEEKHSTTYCDPNRDKSEAQLFDYCYEELQVPMVGICRGSQFLTVMSDGKLWQNVDNHAGRGSHDAVIEATGDIIKVTSTHHQMMIPPDDAEILMTATETTTKERMQDKNSMYRLRIVRPDPQEKDIEAIWIERTKCLCTQFHPEYPNATKECTDTFFEMLYDKILSNDDYYPSTLLAPKKDIIFNTVKEKVN